MEEKVRMKHPNWNKIFDEPVLFSKREGGGKTNDVWHVRTNRGDFIVKLTRTSPHPKKGFWFGLDVLFGLDIYRDLKHQKELAEFIADHSPLTVPRIERIDTSRELYPKPFVIYEYLPGKPANFQEGPDTKQLLYELGNHLGSMDQASFDYWGCFPESPRLEPKEWPSRLMLALRKIAEHRYPGNTDMQNAVKEAEEKIGQLPLPACFTMIMLDLHGEQFLTQDGKLKALVDIESHVIGPRELAWISLEYAMKPEDAGSFIDGYEQHLPAPKLAEVRQIYRLLNFLMYTQVGSFRGWMDQPAVFD
jgi:Ser/Thr protein kinase RdoA (MazF antagonist)